MIATSERKRLARLADRLGKLRARIADLQQKEIQLREGLVGSGESVVEGRLFRVTVSRGTVRWIDFKALLQKLRPSKRLLDSHTRVVERVTISVKARKGL